MSELSATVDKFSRIFGKKLAPASRVSSLSYRSPSKQSPFIPNEAEKQRDQQSGLLPLTLLFPFLPSFRSLLGEFPPASSLGVSTKRDLYLFLLPNEQGKRYNTPGGTNTNQGNAYHYRNSNGSYYYKNDNGSTYYSDPSGKGTYSPPPKN